MKNFLEVFRHWYPYKRYIVENPKPIGLKYEDAVLKEIFSDEDEVYVVIEGPAGSMRFDLFDFKDHIQEEIRDIILNDFGKYAWECLYVDHEDTDDLDRVLSRQKDLIG